MSAPIPERRTISRDNLRQIAELAGLDSNLAFELHLGSKGGHALVARTDADGGVAIYGEYVVSDVVHIDIATELPGGMLVTDTTCRSCRAPISWRRTPAGKLIPLDPAPSRDGNIVLGAHGEATVLNLTEAADTAPEVPRYVSHFSTCPDADTWRSKGGAR